MDKSKEQIGLQSSTDSASDAREDKPRYTLVRRLGKGGTGEVHEGLLNEPDGSQRRVAIKILVDDPTDEPGRLRRMIEQTAQFDHPNVLAPFEFIASSAGRVVLMDYVEGMSVVEMLRRLKRLGRPLPTQLAVEIIVQALEGLVYLHTPDAFPGFSPFIHKNIKPSNLYLGTDGGVRILDLGFTNPLMDAGQRSKGLAVVNVLPYMAPEQLSDMPRLTPTVDLYGLGTVAYELIAGRPLFDGSAARRELEIRVGFGAQDKVRALESILPGIAGVLSRAVALAPSDRFASASEMLKALIPLRPEPQRETLSALIQELQALPEKPLTVTRPADATTRIGQPASETEIRQKLDNKTTVRKVEPIPPGILAPQRTGSDKRLKISLGVASLVIAFLAIWWVDQSRQPEPLDRAVSAERALDQGDKGSESPAARKTEGEEGGSSQ